MTDSRHTGDFLAGLIVGSLVGAATALLFAPQSGEETRAKIRERGIELQDRAGELSAEARQRSVDLQSQARTKAEELSTQAKELSAQAKERAAGVQAKVKQAVAEGWTAASRQKEGLLTDLEVQPILDEPPVEA